MQIVTFVSEKLDFLMVNRYPALQQGGKKREDHSFLVVQPA